MTSLLATETQNKVAACRLALQNIERHLEPLLAKSPNDVARKLGPLEQAELQVGLGYTVASLYFCHLLTQGVDPADHPIKQELDRIQLYFKKLRTIKEEIDNKEMEKERKVLDAEAAQRMLQQYASAAEASMQRRQSAAAATSASSATATPAPASSAVPAAATAPAPSATSTPAASSSEPAAATAPAPAAPSIADAAAPPQSVDTPDPTPETLHATPATTTADVVSPKAASEAPPVQATTPPQKKRRVAGKKSSASPTAGAAPGSTVREPQVQLVPFDQASEEAVTTAASLVAKGKADAARAALRKKRKAEAKAAAAPTGAGGSTPVSATADDEPTLA